MTESVTKEVAREVERAIIYKFLSECFYPPVKKQIEVLNEYQKSVIGIKYPDLVQYLDSTQDFESLLIDHAKLFVGPLKLLAPPYGSVYLESESTLMGNSTYDVEEHYRAQGIVVTLKEVPDHISIELEFMYYLANEKANAIAEQREGLICTLYNKELAFLNDHLACWIEQFSERVDKNAENDFYKKLAKTTSEFVINDRDNLLKTICFL